MPQKKSPSHIELGFVQRVDRVQRLVIGGVLMLLTLTGFAERVEWRGVVAVALQTELLLTGIFGWCPVYWGCKLAMKENLQ